MALDVEHLGDQHDPGPEDSDAGKDRSVGENRMIALKQGAGDAVGRKQPGEDQRDAEQAGHFGPVRGDEAHGAEADQHGTEDAEYGGEVELAGVPGDIAANGGFAVGVDPAGLTPAYEVAVETLGVA